MAIKIVTFFLLSLALVGCTQEKDDIKSAAGQGDASIPVVSEPQNDGTSLIRLTSPQENQILKSPFLVAGEAAVPDDMVFVRVKKPNGDILITEQTRISKTNDGFSPFGILINFQFQSTDKGFVEVYTKGSDTGDELSLVSVPVKFDTSSQTSVSQ